MSEGTSADGSRALAGTGAVSFRSDAVSSFFYIGGNHVSRHIKKASRQITLSEDEGKFLRVTTSVTGHSGLSIPSSDLPSQIRNAFYAEFGSCPSD